MSKSVVRNLSLSTFALAITLNAAIAGVGSSGGGKGVVCRDPQGRINQAMVLDLYEAVYEYGLKLRPSARSLDQDYAIYVQILRRIVGDPRPVGQEVIRQMLRFVRFTASGVHLPAIADAGQVPSLPNACRLEQIAIYHDDTNVLDVDREIWQSLDSLNQAALIAHEEVYKNYRDAGDVTSEKVRSLVGALFSTTPPKPQFAGVSGAYAECWANTGNPSTNDTLFEIVPESNKAYTSLVFRRISGRETVSQVKVTFPVRFDIAAITRYKFPTVVSDSSAKFTGSVRITEGQFKGFVVSMRYQYGKPFALRLDAPNGSLFQSANVDFCSIKQVK